MHDVENMAYFVESVVHGSYLGFSINMDSNVRFMWVQITTKFVLKLSEP